MSNDRIRQLEEQLQALRDWFDELGQTHHRLPPAAVPAAHDDEADEACAAA